MGIEYLENSYSNRVMQNEQSSASARKMVLILLSQLRLFLFQYKYPNINIFSVHNLITLHVFPPHSYFSPMFKNILYYIHYTQFVQINRNKQRRPKLVVPQQQVPQVQLQLVQHQNHYRINILKQSRQCHQQFKKQFKIYHPILNLMKYQRKMLQVC